MKYTAIFACLLLLTGCAKLGKKEDAKSKASSGTAAGAAPASASGDKARDAGGCAAAASQYSALVARIAAEAPACTTDGDCAAYGAANGCRGDKVTSNAVLSAHKADLTAAEAQVNACANGASGSVACRDATPICDHTAGLCRAGTTDAVCSDARATMEGLYQAMQDAAAADGCATDADCAQGPTLGRVGCGGVELFTSAKAVLANQAAYDTALKASDATCAKVEGETDCQADPNAAPTLPTCHPTSKRCVGRPDRFLDGRCDAAEDPAAAGTFKGLCHVRGTSVKFTLGSGIFIKPGSLAATVAGTAVPTAAIDYTPLSGVLTFQGAPVKDGDEIAFAYATAPKEDLDTECLDAGKDYAAFAKDLAEHATCATDADCGTLPARPNDACHEHLDLSSVPALAADGRQAALDELMRRLKFGCVRLAASEYNCPETLRVIVRSCDTGTSLCIKP